MERKSNRKLLWLIAGLIFALAGLLLCAGIMSGSSEPPRATQLIGDPTGPGEIVGSAGAKAAKSAAPSRSLRPTPTVKPPASIGGDDLVHVGEDVPAGTYRAVGKVDSGMCYWSKSRDAEGADITDNDIVQAGRPQVTLKSGQWFKSQGCPTWAKR